MAGLLHLPNEVLITILELVAITNLQSLILLQLTNRRLNALVQDVIYNNTHHFPAPFFGSQFQEIQIHPFLKTKFKGLFNTADCFRAEEKARLAYLTLNGDFTLSFRRLPWTRDETKSKAYLRPEASWRNISLTFGRAPITHLDIIKSYSDTEGDSVDYYQLEIPPSGLTMGLFYDVLLCDTATYRRETGSWELLVEKRLRSYDEARQAAVLYVRGGPVSRNIAGGTDEDYWIPSSQNKQRLLPWQGPIQNLIGNYD
ncbi:hypothetical protein F5B19DRAFT_485084 [Rostrohypoxylon terebratum]|nr:hypothetical protein F5B19DRAFT_485084 [Rostrohypoxylon terebratum]